MHAGYLPLRQDIVAAEAAALSAACKLYVKNCGADAATREAGVVAGECSQAFKEALKQGSYALHVHARLLGARHK